MWRNLKYLHMTDFFLHRYDLWYLRQISSMVQTSLKEVNFWAFFKVEHKCFVSLRVKTTFKEYFFFLRKTADDENIGAAAENKFHHPQVDIDWQW